MVLSAKTWLLACALLGVLAAGVRTQETLPAPRANAPAPPPITPISVPLPQAVAGDRPLPINLPSALQLTNARALDIALASQRIRVAAAQLDRAKVLWLPSIQMGLDYFRHDGQIQNVEGNIFGASKSSLMIGAAPIAVFSVSDAIFAPLVSRQVVRARQSDLQAATNDSTLAVAEAYFNVQQARGELAGALDAARRSEELVRRATQLAEGLVPPVEASRARTENARRRQAVQAAQARWRGASADLVRVLRLDPAALVEPLEPPHLQITLLAVEQQVDDLIPIALTNRPELASRQALVAATLEKLRQERLRPLVPSVQLRGAATNPAGTLAGGYFGAGRNSHLGDFGARSDFDIQVLWELQNLGLGNRARVNEQRAEQQVAMLELFRIQDRVAAEVAQAHADLQSAAARVKDAEDGLTNALDSAEKNFEGLGQTRRAGNLVILVIRPQEAVQAVQALAQAYADYFSSVGDYNRSQFRLYRALGHPAQLINVGTECPVDQPPAR